MNKYAFENLPDAKAMRLTEEEFLPRAEAVWQEMNRDGERYTPETAAKMAALTMLAMIWEYRNKWMDGVPYDESIDPWPLD